MATKTRQETETTRDAIYQGRLHLNQPRQGYRFSIDAILLTEFASRGRHSRLAFDLGTGSGIVGLGLLAAGVADKVVGIEIQPRLASLAEGNAELNHLHSDFQVMRNSVSQVPDLTEPGIADLVIFNPPFWPKTKGRLPQNEECKIACHEFYCGIEDWIKTSGHLLNRRRGRLDMVFPARRFDELILSLSHCCLSATRMRFVHPHISDSAELVLVEARFGKLGRADIEPPLILKNPDGSDTDTAKGFLDGSFAPTLHARRPFVKMTD